MNNLPRFDDVTNYRLRTYNRTVFMSNLMQDGGKEAGRAYSKLFTPQERMQMAGMLTMIQQEGIKAAQAWATDGIPFSYDPGTEVQHATIH